MKRILQHDLACTDWALFVANLHHSLHRGRQQLGCRICSKNSTKASFWGSYYCRKPHKKFILRRFNPRERRELSARNYASAGGYVLFGVAHKPETLSLSPLQRRTKSKELCRVSLFCSVTDECSWKVLTCYPLKQNSAKSAILCSYKSQIGDSRPSPLSWMASALSHSTLTITLKSEAFSPGFCS